MPKNSLFVLLLALTFTGCVKPPPPIEKLPPMPVKVAKPIKYRTVDWDRYTARFAAVDEVEIRARVSGYLMSIHFEEGALVNKGDLLFVIDDAPLRAALAEANAGLMESTARRVEAQASKRQAEAQVQQAAAEMRLSESRLLRAKEAMSTNAIAREEVDVRESEQAQRAAALAAAEARVAAAEASIATAEAAIAASQARVQTAELELSYCRISAPIAGRIGRRLVTEGNLIQGEAGGATLLARIVSLDPIHAYFDASEAELLKYTRLSRAGTRGSSRDLKNPVRARLLDEVGYPHAGHTDFVDSRVETSTGTIQGRAIFRNPEGLFTPGLFAVLRLPASAPYDAILVPDEAVVPDQAGRYIQVVKPGPVNPDQAQQGPPLIQLERVPVTLGPMVRGLRVIRSGLSGDEDIVVSGLMRIFPGAELFRQDATIELKPADAEALPDAFEPVPEAEWIRRNGGSK